MPNFMKTILLAAVLLTALGSCQNSNKDVREAARQSVDQTNMPVQPIQADAAGTQAQNPVPAGPTTTIAFDQERFNFGTIKAGEKVKHVFKFKNTGKEPLVLSDVRSTCGCTVPTWPREPIAPGKGAEIVVEFDSSGKGGSQSRRVTIIANTYPPETFIYMEGEIDGSVNPGN